MQLLSQHIFFLVQVLDFLFSCHLKIHFPKVSIEKEGTKCPSKNKSAYNLEIFYFG